MSGRRWLAIAVVLCASCKPPRAEPLQGIAPVSAHLPAFDLPQGSRLVRFKWTMVDGDMSARGDGAARLSSPDTARVDLFMSGLLSGRGASAIMIGDSLRFPPGAMMTDMVPPAPLLWAALGRLALPAVRDTIIRISGDTLRAALGAPEQWRVTAIGSGLARVERVDGGRIVESVDRTGKKIRYESSARRSLTLEITQDNPVAPFDASIWRY